MQRNWSCIIPVPFPSKRPSARFYVCAIAWDSWCIWYSRQSVWSRGEVTAEGWLAPFPPPPTPPPWAGAAALSSSTPPPWAGGAALSSSVESTGAAAAAEGEASAGCLWRSFCLCRRRRMALARIVSWLPPSLASTKAVPPPFLGTTSWIDTSATIVDFVS